MAPFHFFTDIDSLGNQSATDAFGPVSGASDTQFLVTSIHRPAASVAPSAYAVCDGLLLAQDAGNNLLNLVLKPIQQPPFAFPKIKFFIYRGIQKSSLVSGSDVAPETNNDLTKSIWQSQQSRNASAGTSDNPPAEALGLDISGTGSIEQAFYRDDVSYQLPLVRSGWNLGKLDPAGFGFEIMVEAIGFDPELPIARTAKNVITVTPLPASPTQAQEFEYWHDKEAILTYIDPCAFFGAFYSQTLKVKHADASVTKAKKNEVYDEVLRGAHLPAAGDGVFFNRNRTYLDIRNEYNHSINYFKNYGTYSNTTINCAFDASAAMTVRNYYASTWPLMFVDNGDLPPGNTSKKNLIRLALPDGAGDNPFPTLYISAGYLDDLYPREPKGKAKLIDLTPSAGFTEEVALAIPNRDGLSATTAVSSYVKLKYFKRFDPAATTPPVSSGTVIRAGHYLDNLFAPFGMKIPFAGTAALKSVVYDDELFLDATPLAGVYFSAKYMDQFKYSFICLPKLLAESALSQVIALPAVNSDDFANYLEHISYGFIDVEIKKSFLSINQLHVDYLVASNFTLSARDVFNQQLDGLVVLSIPQSAIPESIPLHFKPNMRVYLGLNNPQAATDDLGQRFQRFDLCARGYAVTNNEIGVSELDLNLSIYLKDSADA